MEKECSMLRLQPPTKGPTVQPHKLSLTLTGSSLENIAENKQRNSATPTCTRNKVFVISEATFQFLESRRRQGIHCTMVGSNLNPGQREAPPSLLFNRGTFPKGKKTEG
jgi:hypothetical protein